MTDKLAIETTRSSSFKTANMSPSTATNELLPRGKMDRLSKSFNAGLASPSTAVNLQLPTPSFERRASFSESDSPINDMSHLLHSLPFFSGLESSDAFIQEIGTLLKVRTFKAGDTVIHFGDVAKCMYLIVRGELGIMSEDNEIEYATLTAGSFVGEIGVLFNTVRTATVICKTKSLLVALTSEDIQSKLDSYPEIREHIRFKGSERLQALENIKNQNNDSTDKEERRGKAGFNVKRSSSFRSSSTSLDSSVNYGSQSMGNTLGAGLLTPDSMNIVKHKASSRRSSINPEALGLSLDVTPDGSLLPVNEPAFMRRKSSFNAIRDDDDQTKLTKSFNVRRKSYIRFDLGDLAISVNDEGSTAIPAIDIPQINFSTPDYQMTQEDIPKIDVTSASADFQEVNIMLPEIKVESSSVTSLEFQENDVMLPEIKIESSSVTSLEFQENDIMLPEIKIEASSVNSLAEDTLKHVESAEDQLIAKETEPRRISVAVWSDPKLITIAKKKEEGNAQASKPAKQWTSVLADDEAVDDQDEEAFLRSSIMDSLDGELDYLGPTEEILVNLIKHLSWEEIFKIRAVCQSMPALISMAKPKGLVDINLSPYFRRLNDRGVIALSRLCGAFIEKMNLHSGYQLTDKSIEILAKSSPNLKYLNLSDLWEIGDNTLVALARNCPSLIHLDLSNCRKITNRGLLSVMESCTKLEILSLSYCKNLTNKVFDHDAWARIKELNLHRCTGIGDRGFEFWPLFIDDFVWSGSASRQFVASADLELMSEENIKGSLSKSGMALDNLNSRDDLKGDGLRDCEDDDDENWEKEEFVRPDFSQSGSDSSDNPAILISKLSHSSIKLTKFSLRSLDLRDCSFLSDTAIASIASVCNDLRVLNLSFCCSLTEDFGKYLVIGCKKLSHLDVSFCGGAVSDEFILEIITGIHRLKNLSIRGCIQVTDVGVEHIIKYSKLIKINYSQCKGISASGKERLKEKYEVEENNSVCEGIAGWNAVYLLRRHVNSCLQTKMKLDASVEYSIQRSTTKDLKPLKPKHIQNITMATAQRDIHMSDLFRSLGGRLKESSSMVALKTLLLIHVMIREGAHERVLGYLAANPGIIDVYHLKDKHDQLKNVREYSAFLEERISAYKNVKEDFVKGKTALITYYKQEPLDEQKLKSIQSLQKLIDVGVGCSCFAEDWQSDNPIQIQAFRLIVGDMIGLFHLLNEAVLRLLAGFFELEKSLAILGLEIYKSFAELTKKVTRFFEHAGRVSMEIGVRIPNFKQAPASLVSTLSDHIKAPNFEEQRVIAREQRALKAVTGKKSKKNKSSSNLSKSGSSASLNSQVDLDKPSATAETENHDLRKKIALKADPVLIDFFASIDDEVQAFESEANQAQFGEIGSLWYPQSFGQDQAGSPHGSTLGLNENSKAQAQIQKQLEQTEQMFASAGFSLQPGAGLSFPAPLSNQSSFNGVPATSLPVDNVRSNPFMPNTAPSYVQGFASSALPFPSTGMNPQTQPFMQPQQVGNYQQPFGATQVPAGQPFNSQLQAQAFAAPLPQSSNLSNSYSNPFAFSDNQQILSNATPFNPFGPPLNPASVAQPSIGNNSKGVGQFSVPSNVQSTPYATLPRANTTQPVVQSKPADLFGDLASLDLSSTAKQAQSRNPNPPQSSFAPFSGNLGMPFAGQQTDKNSQQQPQGAFSSFGGDVGGLQSVKNPLQPQGFDNFGGPFSGQMTKQTTADPFNPFAAPPPVINSGMNRNAPASNPFGNLDFGSNTSGGFRTTNSNGNYIVSSSSNAHPQALFEPRSNASFTNSDPFSTSSQQHDLFAQDPFSIPAKNTNNAFGFQQK